MCQCRDPSPCVPSLSSSAALIQEFFINLSFEPFIVQSSQSPWLFALPRHGMLRTLAPLVTRTRPSPLRISAPPRTFLTTAPGKRGFITLESFFSAWSDTTRQMDALQSASPAGGLAETTTNNVAPKIVPRFPIPPNGVDYRGKVVLAPMVRTGELPTRLMSLKYGADLVWGPETIDRSMIGTVRKFCPRTKTLIWTRISNLHAGTPIPKNFLPPDPDTEDDPVATMPGKRENVLYRLHPEREKGKLIFQMGTSDPERAVEAARVVAADVAGIDVNAGCPKPFSTTGGMGAALLKTPDLLAAILSNLVKHITPEFGIGISVKIRLLHTQEDTEALVRKLVNTGIIALTVHCRTPPMRPRERAIHSDGRLAAVIRICHEAGIACLINGDVIDREHGNRIATEYGADGTMIATSAEKNPSVFRAEKDGGKVEDWRPIVREYINEALAVENKWGNTKFMMGQLVNGKDSIALGVSRSKNYEELVTRLGYLDLVERAREIDEMMGLDTQRAQRKAISATMDIPMVQTTQAPVMAQAVA
jgi:tRNA-dihydrouridine synthase 2